MCAGECGPAGDAAAGWRRSGARGMIVSATRRGGDWSRSWPGSSGFGCCGGAAPFPFAARRGRKASWVAEARSSLLTRLLRARRTSPRRRRLDPTPAQTVSALSPRSTGAVCPTSSSREMSRRLGYRGSGREKAPPVHCLSASVSAAGR